MHLRAPRMPPPVPPEALRGRSGGDELGVETLEVDVPAMLLPLPPPVPPEALRGALKRKATPPPVPAAARVRRRDALASAAPQSSDEPRNLVAAARQGDVRAFNALVHRYRPRILALALHLTGSAHDADDVAQDVFLKAFQRIGEFEGRSAFFTWVYRIAVNRSLQMIQKRRVRKGFDLDDPRVELAVAVDAETAPESALELRETYARLVHAFDRLSPLLRTTVVLTTLQGLTHPEAAAVLGTNEGTVGWRMHEARAQLRRALDDEEVPVLRAVSGTHRVPRLAERDEPDASSYALALALVSVVSA